MSEPPCIRSNHALDVFQSTAGLELGAKDAREGTCRVGLDEDLVVAAGPAGRLNEMEGVLAYVRPIQTRLRLVGSG